LDVHQNGVVTLEQVAAALKEANDYLEEHAIKTVALRDQLIEGLLQIPHAILNGDRQHRLPGNINFCFVGIELLAVGRPHELAHGSLRWAKLKTLMVWMKWETQNVAIL